MAGLKFRIHYWADHTVDRWERRVAWLLPHWLVRWAVVRAYAKAWHDAGDKTPDELSFTEVADGAEAC